MKRNHSLFFLIVLLLTPRVTGHAASPKPLNILFCFADDWGRYANCYAATETRPSINQVLKTPNIDRMAREGVLFRNAFVTAPSCTPCRSSLLSGQYFFRTGRGAILQGAVWDASIPSYPLLLRDAGYHIGKSYKVWSPGTPADAPYGGQQHAYEKAGRDFNNFSENATKLVREGMTFEAAKEKLLGQVRGNFEAFLADRKPGQPFCYWFGPTLTHRKWEKGSGKALWGIEPDSLKGKLPKFLPDVPEVREDFADYMGEIQAWDAGVGVLLQKLEAIGELDNTLVVISGDHGMPGVPGGKCNLYDFGVGVALIARVPGVQRRPRGGRLREPDGPCADVPGSRRREAARRDDRPQSSERAALRQVRPGGPGAHLGGHRPRAARGRRARRTPAVSAPGAAHGGLPLHPQLRARPLADGQPEFHRPSRRAHRSMRLSSNTFVAFADMDASPTKAWLVGQRNEARWKWHYDYAFGKRPGEELYDLRKDPDQTMNVAADPKYAETRATLEKSLMDELKRVGDPRLVDGGKFFETPPMAGPLTDVTSPGKRRGKQK